MERILNREINTRLGKYFLSVTRQDLSTVYPGLIRYSLSINSNGQIIATFSTNSYEYSPTVSIKAEHVVLKKADEWERELKSDPEKFFSGHKLSITKSYHVQLTDVVVIQGSPRADGNCSILVDWAIKVIMEMKKTSQVIFPHDLNIHECIGCYQCYNTGICTYDDDMTDAIKAIQHASSIIVCSPVYTNSVPGGLKTFIDRFQAYHAELTISDNSKSKKKKGLILSVAGRKGKQNFSCVTSVLNAFMRNIGFKPVGELLIDEVDKIRDIRNIPELKNRLRTMILENLN
ncbi:MAG: flavodoxin family protein [Methanoregulaceae archaeon]|jgi:multimeric flavodoxin WrbA